MAAAAAKLLQSCLTLCNPIDCSPPGSPVHGILQARTLEWVAISSSNAWKVKSQSEVAQSCPTPREPMDCSPPGSSVHGIFQARVLEWGAIAFSSHLGSLKLMSAARAMRPEKKKKRIDLGNFRKFWIKLSYINKWLKAVREFIKVTAHKIHTKISTAIVNISWNILKTKRRHYVNCNCQKKFKPPIRKF